MINRAQNDVATGPKGGPNDSLSLAWVMAGVVMFATALGAPVALFHVQNSKSGISESRTEGTGGKLVTTTSREAAILTNPEARSEDLATVLNKGEIVAGVGIGPVMLDTKVRDVLERVEQPSTLTFAMNDSGLQGTHRLEGEDFDLFIEADPGIGLINSVTLAAPDCAALRNFQPRQNGLPATAEGLSLGSHVTRVRKSLGAPDSQSPARGNPPRVQHTYPGLSLSYCAQDMLVGGIQIDRLPPTPVVAIYDAGDVPVTTPGLADVVIAGLDRDRMLPAMPMPRPERSMTVQEPAPLSKSPELPMLAKQLQTASVAIEIPDALLAMNGSAYTVGDAFAAPKQPRDGRIFARAAAPSEMVLAVVRASTAQETNAEFEGVGDFMASKAEINEARLALSRQARGQIQRRLQIVGYDPNGVDGIFGPKTRQVIASLQADRGMAATGFLDQSTVALLKQESQPKFEIWQERTRIARAKAAKLAAKRRALARAEQQNQNVIVARVPAARNAPECARDGTGTIISNQSFSCDVTVLEESLSNLFSGRS
ncbi:MAG: peptidoglycan-binding protein [Paracoccaceae bacterium]